MTKRIVLPKPPTITQLEDWFYEIEDDEKHLLAEEHLLDRMEIPNNLNRKRVRLILKRKGIKNE